MTDRLNREIQTAEEMNTKAAAKMTTTYGTLEILTWAKELAKQNAIASIAQQIISDMETYEATVDEALETNLKRVTRALLNDSWSHSSSAFSNAVDEATREAYSTFLRRYGKDEA